MKPLLDGAGNDRVTASGMSESSLVFEVGCFVAPTVAKCDLMVAWRKRSASAIEKMLAWHLTQARNRANLSQSALAKTVGRPQSFVAKIELNRRPVEVAELVQLCAAMEQDPCELLTTVVQSRSVQELLALMEVRKSSEKPPISAVTGNAQ